MGRCINSVETVFHRCDSTQSLNSCKLVKNRKLLNAHSRLTGKMAKNWKKEDALFYYDKKKLCSLTHSKKHGKMGEKKTLTAHSVVCLNRT